MAVGFTKIEGTGNDFIYFDSDDWTQLLKKRNPESQSDITVSLCDRHRGIGADGVVIIETPIPGDPKMTILNADGSVATMCGNATRCTALYLKERGLANKVFTLQTDSGAKSISIKSNNGAFRAEVNLGMDDWKGSLLFHDPLSDSGPNHDEINQRWIEFGGQSLEVSILSTGTPHCVIFTDDLTDGYVKKWGPLIERDGRFPQGVNVEFARVINENEVKARVWERGCGETLACGTGAAAICAAGMKSHKTGSPLLCHMAGGDLLLTKRDDGIYKEGPARIIYKGEIFEN